MFGVRDDQSGNFSARRKVNFFFETSPSIIVKQKKFQVHVGTHDADRQVLVGKQNEIQ